VTEEPPGPTEQARAVTRRAVALVAVAHVAVLAYMLAVAALLRGTGALSTVATEAFVRWDAVHYMRIAREGYADVHGLVLLPLYPLLVSASAWLLRDPLAAALTVTLLAHLGAAWCLARLMLLDHPPPVVERAILFLAVFPTALFASLPYAEALFLFFVAAALLCFRTRHMVGAGIFAFLAVCTRLPGLALVAAMAAEYVFRMRREVRPRAVLFPLLFPLVGCAVYLLLNERLAGDPFFFLSVQESRFHRGFAFPWLAAARALRMAWAGTWFSNVSEGIDEVAGAALAAAATVYAFRRLRLGDAVYCLGSTLMFTFQAFWACNLRYCFVLFPVYVMLARASGRAPVRLALVGLSMVWLALLALQYARGHWAG
jgi:hypothetical protein